MKLHRMPVTMTARILHRKGPGSDVHLKPGRVPTLDGEPVELTAAELSSLRRERINPVPQAESREFTPKAPQATLPAPAVPAPLTPAPEAKEPERQTESSQPLAKVTPRKVPKGKR